MLEEWHVGGDEERSTANLTSKLQTKEEEKKEKWEREGKRGGRGGKEGLSPVGP